VARNKPIRITILGNAKKATATISQTSRALTALGKAGKGLAKITAPLASFTSLIGPATSGVLALAKGVTALGKTAGALAPLIAFAPAAAGAYALLRLTLTKVGVALGEAFQPLVVAFNRAGDAAGRLATKGVAPLAREFVRLNMPAISGGMDRIAVSTNRAVLGFGRWVNSAAGQKLVRDTTNGTASAFERAEPAITRAAIALGELANRAKISDRLAALGDTIAGLIDRFTNWANATSSADIDRALKTAADATEFLRDKLIAIRDAITWLADNQVKIKQFSNVLAGLGLALSIYTLNPVGIAVAAFTLLANNWDTTKKVFSGASDFWEKTWAGASKSPALTAFRSNTIGSFSRITDGAKSFGTSVTPAFAQIGGALKKFGVALLPTLTKFGEQFSRVIGPALADIGVIIRDQVAPAFASFLTAVTPIAKFLLGIFGSAVIGALKGVVNVLKGALVIISGVFNVISGILTGDWSKAWEGIKQIVAGAFTAIIGIVQVFLIIGVLKLFRLGFSLLRGIAVGGWGVIKGLFTGALNGIRTGIVAAVRGYFGLWSSFFRGVWAIVVNGWKVLRSAFGGALAAIRTIVATSFAAVRGVFARAFTAIRGIVTGAGPRIVGALKGIVKKIDGVFAGASKFLKGAGEDIVRGLWDGVRSLGAWLADKVTGFINSTVPGPIRRALGINSPSKVAKGIGRFFGLGLGLGLVGQEAAVRKAAKRLMAGIATKADKNLLRSATNKALADVNRQVKALKAAADKQRAVLAGLVQQRKDYAAQIKDSFKAGGITSVSLEGLGTDPQVARSALVTGLQARLRAIKDFQAKIAALRKRGLSTDIIRQIADSGLETGAQYLASLSGASPALIKQINQLNGAITRGAAGVGGTVADALFGGRISAEQAKLARMPTVIRIDSSGSRIDDLLLDLLRKAIRKQGGNVQVVLGR
jgi:hypothetical protein